MDWLQKTENSRTLQTGTQSQVHTTTEAAETPSTNHTDTTSQQGGNDEPTEQHDEKRSGVMAKANSLNEVSNRDFDTLSDVAHTRTSLDAESGSTANRKRRQRYSPSRNNVHKVSLSNDSDDDEEEEEE